MVYENLQQMIADADAYFKTQNWEGVRGLCFQDARGGVYGYSENHELTYLGIEDARGAYAYIREQSGSGVELLPPRLANCADRASRVLHRLVFVAVWPSVIAEQGLANKLLGDFNAWRRAAMRKSEDFGTRDLEILPVRLDASFISVFQAETNAEPRDRAISLASLSFTIAYESNCELTSNLCPAPVAPSPCA